MIRFFSLEKINSQLVQHRKILAGKFKYIFRFKIFSVRKFGSEN